ncbi:MAG: tetratricopeptide repeat protein [Cognaticolwellia sp.]|jgi:tetratricopeptide (TPR) repeat protein
MNWQNLLTKGNTYFDKQQWTKAELYYKSAFSQLEGRWESGEEHESLLMAWVCACHNLGTLFETQGDHERAIGYLLQAYQEAHRTSQNELASYSLRSLAFNALKTSLNAILSFTQKHPTCDHCLEKLERLQTTLNFEAQTLH